MAVRACRVHTTPVGNCFACQALTLPRGGTPGARLTRAVHRGPLVRLVPSEHEEQAAFFAWAEIEKARIPELEELFAVPNFSGRLGNVPPVAAIRQAELLNAEGRKKGVEDVLLLIPRGRYHGWLGETKRVDATDSDVRAEQRWWHVRHRARGYRVDVCKGCEALRAAVLAYLALPECSEASR